MTAGDPVAALREGSATSGLSDSGSEFHALLLAPVGQASLQAPVFVDAGLPVAEALRELKARQATSLLVRDGRRVGLFTAVDLREAVLAGADLSSAPVGGFASFELVTVRAEEMLFEAMMLMARHGVQRLVVMRGAEVAGVLDQVQMLGYLSSNSLVIASRIQRAGSIEELNREGREISGLVRTLHGHGIKVEHLARLTADLNARVYAAAWAMVAPPELVANSCLFVMGSEGRAEQILKTDQDNGLVIRDGFDSPAIPAACEGFTRALLELGWPECPGKVMVNNPRWAKPLATWQKDLRRWELFPDEQDILDLAIFYDASPVAGDPALLGAAKGFLFEMLSDNDGFRARFAAATESFKSPLGLFSRIQTEKEGERKGQLNLKKGAIFPIVHGVRSLALERKLEQTGTSARIRRLRELSVFGAGFAHELAEVFEFLSELRLSTGLKKLDAGLPGDNYVTPGALTRFERDGLRDSLIVVKRLRDVIRLHFQLDRLYF